MSIQYVRGYFDGSCEPVNPGGEAKWGFAVIDEDDCVLQIGHGRIGKGEGMTNNIAEYQALIECLRYLNQYHEDDLIEVYGDSKMVLMMTEGSWGRKRPHNKAKHLKPLLDEARKLYNNLDNCALYWIPREENQLADYLSKL